MKIKKVSFFSAIVLAVALSLSACTDRPEASKDPAEEADPDVLAPGEKIELTLTTFDAEFSDLGDIADTFNQTSDRYHVNIRDLQDEASLYPGITVPEVEAQLLKRLNTEIMAGDYPDMLCFHGASPLPFIHKGLLVDMNEFLSQDPELSLDDLAVKAALEAQNGIYYIGRTFSYSTFVGLSSNFGDRYGWTLADYLAFEQMRPGGTGIFSNVTRQNFLYSASLLYAPTVVDWENGVCDFANNDFISILETAGRIQEVSQESLGIEIRDDGYNVGTGKVLVDGLAGHKVWNLANAERNAGARLSCVGFPTVDGSWGSRINLAYPVGIFSNSEHIDGCWEFIRFMIVNTGPDKINEGLDYSMPVYLPSLRQMAEAEKNHVPVEAAGYDFLRIDRESPIQMTEEDVQRFFDLLDHIDKLNMESDLDTILDIIADEGAAYFQGSISAQEAAQHVQDKVSLYLAELG